MSGSLVGRRTRNLAGRPRTSLAGKLRRWVWNFFTFCLTESQLSPSQSHPPSAHGLSNPMTPITGLTSVCETTATTTCRVICEEAKMDDANLLPAEEEDILYGETEFWELVFLGSDTQRIAKIIPIDLDLDNVSKSNQYHSRVQDEELRADQEEIAEPTHEMTELPDSRAFTRELSFAIWLATDEVKKD